MTAMMEPTEKDFKITYKYVQASKAKQEHNEEEKRYLKTTKWNFLEKNRICEIKFHWMGLGTD